MITQTNNLRTVAEPVFPDSHSAAIRIWHWTFVVFIFGAITTVTLATFVFNTGKNIPMVQQQLQQKGITVDGPTARAVSHAFNDKCWELHTYIGYGIAILVFGRWLIEALLPRPHRLIKKMIFATGFRPTTVQQTNEKKHYMAVKWGYIVFYVLITIMVLTGLGLAFEDVPFLRSIRRPVKSVHSFTQYLIYAFAVLHIAGVVRADNRLYPGLVSGMIGGKRTR